MNTYVYSGRRLILYIVPACREGHASPEPLVQTHFQKKFLYSLIARDKQQLLRYFNQVNVQQNEENANQPNALLVLLLLLRKLTSH